MGRAWRAIHDGSIDEMVANTERFFRKYAKHIYGAKEYKVDDFTAEDMARSCQTCQHTAAAMDGLEPAEINLISMQTYAWIAVLLMLIESGSPWPKGPAKARAAFLEKDEGACDIPRQFRVLLMLPCLYRRWAAARLHGLKDWTDQWGLPQISAGLGSRGAEDAWMNFSIEIEHMQVHKQDFCGGAVDIAKCFDQI